MALLPNADRVGIWNALFLQAFQQASALAGAAGKRPRRQLKPKVQLTADQRSRLLLLAFCTLAIEARANHLIDELVERGRLTEHEAQSLQRLSADAKWFLLPKLWGVRKRLKRDHGPHQAVLELCSKRNVIFHVNFRRLSDGLPDSGKMLSLFSNFVAAMEDLNVVLRRARGPRRAVLEVGQFV